jgi:integrase
MSDPYSWLGKLVTRHSGGTLSCHALRRSFAVAWLRRGGTESSLERLCGWTSGAMINRYIAAEADVLAREEYVRLLGG